ncbi:MAG: hypothetical protein LBB56_07495 [Chitinispirillales bacterium]|jgi:hypothetical protein|nr:hypothetical protein [Chitinispirillales bacterium]
MNKITLKLNAVFLTPLFFAAALLASEKYSVYGDMAAEVLVSPRSAALSSSDLAINGAGPLVSNPSLAAAMTPHTLTWSYSSYYGDVFSASMLNYTGPIGKRGGFGVSAAYLLIPGIEDTRGVDISAVNTDDIEVFTASDVWARFSYGHRFETEFADLHIGAALTARRRRLETIFAYGMCADIGVMAHFKKQPLYAALLWENVRYGVVDWQGADYNEKVPQHIRLSLAFERDNPYIYGRFALLYTSPDLLFNEGINHEGQGGGLREEDRAPQTLSFSDGASVLFSAGRYGVEYTIMNTLTLRVGFNNYSYSMGAGLNLFNDRAGVDFGYLSHELAGTVKMSITYRWF